MPDRHIHIHLHSDPALVSLLGTINSKLDTVITKENSMATQADIDALSQRLGAAVSAIQQEITDIQNANPSLDLTGLNNAVAQVEGLELPPASPATPDAPPDQPPAADEPSF